ncbi:hypothetical protein [Vreelandella neptunia]|uniref:Uncharacterized protein n=1 Tax=Vreelandella neptunia TaxID=115551 RepID=A0ABZ0YR33_9GAMM|nr:hypothetical protein [Halomonas neptunia]MDN3561723.1 hypothetical protein [Halomonas neptunia]WQH14624.1 hypothetical protein SR894_08815 [Halomonas neptunia]
MSRDVADDHPEVRMRACEYAIMALVDALNRNGQSDVAHAAYKAALSYSIQESDMQGNDPDKRIAGHTEFLFRGLDESIPRFD